MKTSPSKAKGTKAKAKKAAVRDLKPTKSRRDQGRGHQHQPIRSLQELQVPPVTNTATAT